MSEPRPIPEPETTGQVWLRRFSKLLALSTLALIFIGGLVTSTSSGLSVPDWPTTYGYNMFLFPISQWVGGIFYEHTHRLYASLVGLLTVVLAVWLHLKAADRRRARFAVILGEDEVAQGIVSLRNLSNSEQSTVKREEFLA